MDSARDLPCGRGCPIRRSADRRALASPRGFSQRATSFVASWRLGIHRTPFSRSRSQPPPPACSTEPRPKARHLNCTGTMESHPSACTHTFRTTQPIPDSHEKEQGPSRRIAPTWPVFWKRRPAGCAIEVAHPVRRISMRILVPRICRQRLRRVRQGQGIRASRVESGARRGAPRCWSVRPAVRPPDRSLDRPPGRSAVLERR